MDEPRMYMPALKTFHRSMLDHGKKSARIPFTYASIPLDVHFFTEDTPFILGIGIKGANPIYFEVPVEKGYRVNIKLGKYYGILRDALNLKYDENGRFRTEAFFKALNASIPSCYHERNNELRPEHRATFVRDVEEADKVYFMGWQHNGDLGIRKPTKHNLEKTRKLLGEAAYERAVRENLSSRWTDVEAWAIRVSYGDYM